MPTLPVYRFAALVFAMAAAHLAAHPETAEANAEMDRLIAEFPKEPELYLRRAAHRIENGDYTAAETDVRRAQKLDPRSPRVFSQLGQLNFARGALGPARKYFDTALSLEPRDAESLILRARVHAQLDDATAAHADYTAALGLLASPSPDLFLARAALPIPPELAVRGLDEGLARLGPSAPLLERALGLELQLGRTDAALKRLDTLAAGAERKETFWKRRGDILAAVGRTAEAHTAYATALAAVAALPQWLRDSPETKHLATELARLSPPTP